VPLKNYDDLSVGEIEKKLQGLSKDDIEAVLDYEKNNKNRQDPPEDARRQSLGDRL